MRAQTLRTMVLFYGTEDGDGPGLYSTSAPTRPAPCQVCDGAQSATPEEWASEAGVGERE